MSKNNGNSKTRIGRPSKLVPETRKRVIEAIRAGVPFRHAAALGDIGESTFYRWMERGEAEESGGYREFREAVMRAKTEGMVARVLMVHRAAMKGDWRAAMALLRHDDPEYFADRHRHDHSGKVSLSVAEFFRRASERLEAEKSQEADRW